MIYCNLYIISGFGGNDDVDNSIKSPISLVHEIALKRNMNVTFNVVSEKGPPHMKTFITECIVGEFKAEGEGNGKKVSCLKSRGSTLCPRLRAE